MSNVYTLETLKADLDREFAPLVVELGGKRIILRNLLRINDSDRTAVMAALDKIQTDESDTEENNDRSAEEVSAMTEAVNTVLQHVCSDNMGDQLVKYIDGDLMLAMKILEMWTEATQPGEAPNSST